MTKPRIKTNTSDELYQGYEMFYDTSYYGMVACRLKGERSFNGTQHFNTMLLAKEYVDSQIKLNHETGN